ncbi:GNAT family N-acetyltransferase [Aeromicrobium sp. CF3.5]|uniref:GNAT family N-acetyltransferase n=1 Tax=Aeromicrobium sp. CF3.5 TaxID=3373078 RepID=UPI003EE441F1
MATIRPLEVRDDEPIRRLFVEGFGDWDDPHPRIPFSERKGRSTYVTEVDGQLRAAVSERHYDSWFGGAQIPTAGVSSVTVQAESRGHGLLSPLFEAMSNGARERGALLSTLYPTSPGIYRRFGYAPIVDLMELRVPTLALAVPGDTVPTRRATAADLPGIREVYRRWAADHNGPLTRLGESFPDPDQTVISSVTGFTVAESSPGAISGYVAWDRGRGYGAEASIKVWDLHADDPASLVSLMRSISSFSSVADTTVIRTSGDPEWRQLLRQGSIQQVHRSSYAMAVLDVGVLERMHYPDGLEVGMPFSWKGTGHVLEVSAGRAQVQSADVGAARSLDAAGLALTISGAQRSAALRRLGHLTGDTGDDEFWDFLFGSRQPHIRDYF